MITRKAINDKVKKLLLGLFGEGINLARLSPMLSTYVRVAIKIENSMREYIILKAIVMVIYLG